MGWPLRFQTEEERQRPRTDAVPIGTCWFSPDWLKHAAAISPKYLARWAHLRAPICIQMPGGSVWCPDCRARGADGWYGDGWDVTGEIGPERCTLTCSPSINFPGHYHGYVQNGVITDDCEGRVFPA